MLYATTCNHTDAVTAHHILTEARGTDGGLLIPFHVPVLSGADLGKLKEMSFNQRISAMLNLFFSGKLKGWDLDFSIGRYPVRLKDLPYKLTMGEFWHNPQWQYGYLEKKVTELVSGNTDCIGSWTSVAIRMAVLGAAVLERWAPSGERTDISVTDDLTVAVSAWYLRKMGFPVGNIVYCCTEGNPMWDLICLGQMKTDSAVPLNLERWISCCCGPQEVRRFLSCLASGAMYSVSDPVLQELRKGLYVSVVSDSRIETAIPNVFKTHNYVLQPDSALAYCGLLDYRARTGISRQTLIVCDESPVCKESMICEHLGLSGEELLKLL